jgi:putative hydrolase
MVSRSSFPKTESQHLEKVGAGQLTTIALRRFNVERNARLPVLHSARGRWLLFWKTSRAHEVGRTRGWAMLHFYDDDHAESQRTVVTARRGPLTGRRVIRGRETECRSYYGAREAIAA